MRPPTEVDVVVSGRGLKGHSVLGARHAIASRGDLAVRRFAGNSAGGTSAGGRPLGGVHGNRPVRLIDLSDSNWRRTYAVSAKAVEAALQRREAPPALVEIYRNEVFWPRRREELPAGAYERCRCPTTTAATAGAQRAAAGVREGLTWRPVPARTCSARAKRAVFCCWRCKAGCERNCHGFNFERGYMEGKP